MRKRQLPDEFYEDEYTELNEMSDEQLERIGRSSGEQHRRSRARDVLTSRTPRTRKPEDS